VSHADSNPPSPGLSEFQAGNYDRALPLLWSLAQNGDAEAQCMVGNIYQLGLGSVVPDLHNAIVWYSRAAAQGYGVASNNLAGMYLVGAGVSADSEQAQQLYEQARAQGFTSV